MAEKSRIRHKMRSALARLSSSSKSNAAAALVSQLLSSDEFRLTQSVGMYVPIAKWEIDIAKAVWAGLDQGKNIALPRWNATDRRIRICRHRKVESTVDRPIWHFRAGRQLPQSKGKLSGRGFCSRSRFLAGRRETWPGRRILRPVATGCSKRSLRNSL